ncbi:MAG TPA: diaminopropionate ammonia-lyase [Ktedonobacterales bacterium]|nr:diaminopropionate ammonia-lyase [Ktedonobacterales bacterium]
MPNDTIVFPNPQAMPHLEGEIPGGEAFDFHQKLLGYRPSPLINAPGIADVLGVGKVWVKDESSRFGLPAFKFLGASWAVYRVLLEQMGGDIEPWQTFDDLKERFAPLKPLTLIAATDGNHGRAVARMGRLLGFASHILVPRGMAQARIDAIQGEGADVTMVDRSYDDAVTLAAALAADDALVISDTAWEGYTQIPRWIMEGYTTILRELDDQLAAAGDSRVDLVAAQMGVGGLATAVVWRYRRLELADRPKIVGVEPLAADAILRSARAGRMVEAPGPHTSIMAGLCCGVPSLVAWPIISRGVDVFVAIDDEWAREAMRALARAGVVSGETGAAGLAGLLALLSGPERERHRQLLGLTPESRVVVISTEGATDPVSYQHIVG